MDLSLHSNRMKLGKLLYGEDSLTYVDQARQTTAVITKTKGVVSETTFNQSGVMLSIRSTGVVTQDIGNLRKGTLVKGFAEFKDGKLTGASWGSVLSPFSVRGIQGVWAMSFENHALVSGELNIAGQNFHMMPDSEGYLRIQGGPVNIGMH